MMMITILQPQLLQVVIINRFSLASSYIFIQRHTHNIHTSPLNNLSILSAVVGVGRAASSPPTTITQVSH